MLKKAFKCIKDFMTEDPTFMKRMIGPTISLIGSIVVLILVLTKP